jgi:hypothetical protein
LFVLMVKKCCLLLDKSKMRLPNPNPIRQLANMAF